MEHPFPCKKGEVLIGKFLVLSEEIDGHPTKVTIIKFSKMKIKTGRKNGSHVITLSKTTRLNFSYDPSNGNTQQFSDDKDGIESKQDETTKIKQGKNRPFPCETVSNDLTRFVTVFTKETAVDAIVKACRSVKIPQATTVEIIRQTIKKLPGLQS